MGEEKLCGFCGKGEGSVNVMIKGPLVCVCSECVELMTDMIKESVEHGRT
jgi:ATP-dependent protease Clp ATPase subunit